MTMIIDCIKKVGDDDNSDDSGDDDGDDDVSSVGVEGDSWKLIRRLDYYLGPRVHNYLKGWRLVGYFLFNLSLDFRPK